MKTTTQTAIYLRDGYAGKGRGLAGWYRDITIREAKCLNSHQSLYTIDRSGCVREVRTNGQPKTWKRSPGCELSMKYGLRECFRVGGKERTDAQAISHPSQARILLPVRKAFDADTPSEIVTDWVTDFEMG